MNPRKAVSRSWHGGQLPLAASQLAQHDAPAKTSAHNRCAQNFWLERGLVRNSGEIQGPVLDDRVAAISQQSTMVHPQRRRQHLSKTKLFRRAATTIVVFRKEVDCYDNCRKTVSIADFALARSPSYSAVSCPKMPPDFGGETQGGASDRP